MISRERRAVARISAFIDLSGAEIAFLASLPGDHRTYKPGEIIRDEQAADSFDLLLDGWAANSLITVDGNQRINSVHLPGDLLGMATFVLKEPFDRTFALTEATVHRMPSSVLRDIFANYPRIAAAILLIAQEERAAKMEWNSLCNATGSMRRLAAFFLRTAERLQVLHEREEHDFAFPLTQKQIAEYISVTPVYMTRLLRQLESQRFMRLSGSRLQVLDLKGLRDFAGLPEWHVSRPRWLSDLQLA